MDLDPRTDSVIVRSANIDIGDLPARAPKDLARVVAKYFDPLHGASVYVARERRLHRCTINVQAGGSGVVTSEASGFSCHEAFDTALRKIAKQLRRRKRALEQGHGTRLTAPARAAERAGEERRPSA